MEPENDNFHRKIFKKMFEQKKLRSSSTIHTELFSNSLEEKQDFETTEKSSTQNPILPNKKKILTQGNLQQTEPLRSSSDEQIESNSLTEKPCDQFTCERFSCIPYCNGSESKRSISPVIYNWLKK